MDTKGTIAYDATCAVSLTQQAQAALTSAKELVIDSPSMYEIAADELKQIKAMQKSVEAQRVAITGPMNAALSAVNDFFRAPKDFLVAAEQSVKVPMVAYATEQERLAAVARRKAEDEARAERERLAAVQREQERVAREAANAADAAIRAAQEAAAAGDAEAAEKAKAKAETLREQSESAALDAQETAMESEVMTMAPAVVAPAKTAGIAVRITYTAQVTDLMALVKAVAEGKAPIQCLKADDTFIGSQARAFKKPGELFPGVTCSANRGIASRSA